ncbi:MAG: response regulator [Deltaproteobacteria bacterium]|nr:response regulator [Deltaproteobacteria bacterium]
MQPLQVKSLLRAWSGLERRLLPASVFLADRLTLWRERILLAVSLLAMVLGPLALVPSLALAYAEDRWGVICLDLAAYLAVVAVFLLRRRSLRFRGVLVCCTLFGLGLGLIILLGPFGAGYMWLFAASVLAGGLIGLPAALTVLLGNFLAFVAVAFLVAGGLLPWADSTEHALHVWVVMAINFLLLNTLVAVTTALILRGLRLALEHEQEVSASLRQNEARFRSLTENAPDIVFTVDAQGRFTYANPALTSLLGYPSAAVAGRFLASLAPAGQAEGLQAALARVSGEGATVRGVAVTLRHKNGQVRHFLMGGAPLEDGPEESPGAIGILKDVTEQALLTRQLQQSQKMEALGILSGGIAHDFNNIINVVLGYGELAVKHSLEGQPVQKELGEVLRAADRARNLVKRILTFSRKEEPDLQPLDLNQAVSQIMLLLRHTLPKMIELTSSLAPDLGPVRADAGQIEQVLMNLATNAADAMPEGGSLSLETKNTELDQEFCRQHPGLVPGRYVEILVSDTGGGMSAATQEHIFEPFFTTKEVGKGTGLGLSMVYGIVQTHGGHITCYSEPGRGTVFRIFLPQSEDGLPAPELEAPRPEEILGGSEEILLVDDEEALRDMGATALREMGYRVRTAMNGEESVQIYQNGGNGIDLVVMDLGMPGMGGHKALQQILAHDPAAKVVIASGYAASGQVKASLEAGAAGFVAKPFRRLDLLTTIRQVLDQTRA